MIKIRGLLVEAGDKLKKKKNNLWPNFIPSGWVVIYMYLFGPDQTRPDQTRPDQTRAGHKNVIFLVTLAGPHFTTSFPAVD